MNSYEAVIFDMDGVLVDSEPFDFEAINSVLASFGHEIDAEMYKSIVGLSDDEGWQVLMDRLGLPGDIDHYIAMSHAALFEAFQRPHEPLPGARDLLAELKRRSVPFGLATSAAEQIAE